MRTLCMLLWCMASAAGAEGVSIPLKAVLTTSSQEGMLRVRDAFPLKGIDAVANKAVHHHLKGILQASDGGASNVFLVDAATPGDAVKASSSVLVGARSAEIAEPINRGQLPIRGSHWLVAYPGSGSSSPPLWKVDEISVSETTVTVKYRRPQAGIRTMDIAPYYYWAPLGKLTPGAYSVELYDANAQAMTLMRRVIVKPER